MTGPAPSPALHLSVVVPVYNEEANARALVERVVEAARGVGRRFELIVVDDGSRDGTLEALRGLVPATPELVVVALRRNYGQTLALQAGLDRARGDVIVTMDGDLQNDPADIPRLLAALDEGADVVSGWRRQRQDTLILRKVPSWIANALIRRVTGVPIHDQGCALKAYRREVIRELHLYGDMHRFIAILTMPVGARLAEIEVQHHARRAGTSKYGLSRTFKVVADLFTIEMLAWFRESPLRWFALLGLPFLALALLALPLWLASSAGSVVYPTVAFIGVTTFAGCLFLGLLGDAVIDSAGRGGAGGILAHERRRSDADD
jgi:glycosyltransferase involved in cell wall biosynthesis